MDYDSLMLFVKENPDCSSVDIADHFGVATAKAFNVCNQMIRLGLMYKTTVQSKLNRKMIYGYRVMPWFDEPERDNADGSIRRGEIYGLIRRCDRVHGRKKALQHLASFNEWREVHGVSAIRESEIFT